MPVLSIPLLAIGGGIPFASPDPLLGLAVCLAAIVVLAGKELLHAYDPFLDSQWFRVLGRLEGPAFAALVLALAARVLSVLV